MVERLQETVLCVMIPKNVVGHTLYVAVRVSTIQDSSAIAIVVCVCTIHTMSSTNVSLLMFLFKLHENAAATASSF